MSAADSPLVGSIEASLCPELAQPEIVHKIFLCADSEEQPCARAEFGVCVGALKGGY
jgi:hypothetical protein